MAGKKGGTTWTPKWVKGHVWRQSKNAVPVGYPESMVAPPAGGSTAVRRVHPNQGGKAPSSHTSTSSHKKLTPPGSPQQA